MVGFLIAKFESFFYFNLIWFELDFLFG